jgi:hypothetical protein
MAIKTRFFIFFMCIAGFLALPLAAQTGAGTGYFIDTQSGEPRFIQRLAWTGGENALRYEVVIQMEQGGTYTEYLREFTTALFIEVSLHPGKYRFHVITYDLLNRPALTSDWSYIEVRQALKPEVSEAVPEYVPRRRGEPSGFILNVQGNNLDPQAEYVIQFPDGTTVVPKVIDAGDGRNVRLFIEEDKLLSAEYEVVVKNPGGLEGMGEGIVDPEEIKPIIDEEYDVVLIDFGVNWQPVFMMYGDGDRILHKNSFGAHLNILINTPLNFYIGPELTMSLWHLDFGNAFTEKIVFAGINLVVMKWLYDYRLGFAYRLGAGYRLVNFSSFIQDDYLRYCVNMGVSIHWRFAGIFALETGVDYSHILGEERHTGYLRPFAGLGIVF